MHKSKNNKIYINAGIKNTTDSPLEVVFSSVFDNCYLSCPENYYISVIRFVLPNSGPIFSFKDVTYQVKLKYQNSDYTQFLTYFKRSNSLTSEQPVNSFQHFLIMINNALKDAYNLMVAANPGLILTISTKPYIIYDPFSKLFSLVVAQNYENTVEISFNNNLNNFFKNSFDQISENNYHTFAITRSGNNSYVDLLAPTIPSYIFTQEVPTLYQWYDMKRITFSSGTIPVSAEHVSTSRSDGSSISEKIVTDFAPEISSDKSDFIYEPTVYRLVDLNGSSPLNTFDITVRYITKSGEIMPYKILPGESATCKVGFFRKDTI